MARGFWLMFGAVSQLLFVMTVCRLFPFLRGGRDNGAPFTTGPWFVTDALLALQFAVVHSVLLYPKVRKTLSARIPSPQYGCFFCAVTCVCLLFVTETWQPSRGAVWRLQGFGRAFVEGAFLASWVALVYSLSLTGLGYQTGWTTWWAWVRGRDVPKRTFEPRGAYHMLRHPVYLSFLGLIWFNPVMTFDRMTLAVTWTAHIFLGSYLKDRRLVHYIGAAYQRYQSRVPGYPFIAFGPLGKVPPPGGES
ncbi:MAG: NnrU family protein [Isosphaeraceae bacterium]|nr:NnrU family protein [Isosphaeraceae bacterium]